jgi:hypothetical protein
MYATTGSGRPKDSDVVVTAPVAPTANGLPLLKRGSFMTTIASDGTTVAADGLYVCGTEIIARNKVKLLAIDGTLYGFTGSYRLFDSAIRWHKSPVTARAPLPALDPQDKDDSWRLLVFKPAQCVCYFKGGDPEFFPYPCAFGHGEAYAMGALLAGATPKAAVEIAATLDVYTGGRILVETIPVDKNVVLV